MTTIHDGQNSSYTVVVTPRSPEDFASYNDPESAAEALKVDSAFSLEDQYLRQEATMALASLADYYPGAEKVEALLPALRNGYRAAAMAGGVQIDRLPSDVFIDACVSRLVEELLGDDGGVLAAEIAELFETVSAVYARAMVCRPPEH